MSDCPFDDGMSPFAKICAENAALKSELASVRGELDLALAAARPHINERARKLFTENAALKAEVARLKEEKERAERKLFISKHHT